MVHGVGCRVQFFRVSGSSFRARDATISYKAWLGSDDVWRVCDEWQPMVSTECTSHPSKKMDKHRGADLKSLHPPLCDC